jgi:hypothetical protein
MSAVEATEFERRLQGAGVDAMGFATRRARICYRLDRSRASFETAAVAASSR